MLFDQAHQKIDLCPCFEIHRPGTNSANFGQTRNGGWTRADKPPLMGRQKQLIIADKPPEQSERSRMRDKRQRQAGLAGP